jgi:hypothetical protein
MEGHHVDSMTGCAQQAAEARTQLTGSLRCKREREDARRWYPTGQDQVGDSRREHRRLPRAGTSHYEERPIRSEHGPALLNRES